MSTILVLAGIAAGGLCGLLFGPSAEIVSPVGDIFLNLIFVLVVPLVFLSVATSMFNLKKNKMVGKVLGTTAGVFLVQSLIAGLLALVVFAFFHPFEGTESISLSQGVESEVPGLGYLLVNALTVNDFPLLFSRRNLLPLIVFAALCGLAAASAGEKAEAVDKVMNGLLSVVMRMMDLVMKLAPVGLGCYFAVMIGQMGASVASDYLKILVIYSALALVVFVVVHTIYIVLCGMSVREYWKNMITPSLTAIATCSSAACMPVNIAAAKKMGVRDEIAEAVIPLGTNLHKDGSVMTGVVKVMFAAAYFGFYSLSPGSMLMILGVAVLVSIVVGAVPVGGMTAEILVCSVLGLDPSFAAVLMIIGTVVDIPATLVNSAANVTGTVIVDKICRR